MLHAFLAGLALGGSLIVAIGAQNAFIIRQGILGRHVFWLCLFCALSDTLLIWAGTFGMGLILKKAPALITLMTYGGAAFLIWYGLTALRRAFNPHALAAATAGAQSFKAALAACAAFTFLNPHVYLDAVILVGSIANARPTGEQIPFATGASTASFIWFFGLGYGATLLRPWLLRPAVWRGIDVAIAAIMFLLAAKLLIG